jgi:PQQ-dependent dehydrogenase (methanol/ethanol family)
MNAGRLGSCSRISMVVFILFIGFIGAIPVIPQGKAQSPNTGKQQFVSHCAACHGEDGHGGQLGPNIVDVPNPRATSLEAVKRLIRSGVPSAGMPPFASLSDAEVDSIAAYVMTLKAPATPAEPTQPAAPVRGDIKAGFNYYMHEGNCFSCHAIQGRGGVIGPDLTNVGHVRTAALLQQALLDPGSLPQAAEAPRSRQDEDDGSGWHRGPVTVSYAAAMVKLLDGRTLRGVLKSETAFDVQLMGLDGHLYLLSRDQVVEITRESQSLMPKVQVTPEQMQNLVAYLSQLKGDANSSVPLPPLDLGPGVAFADIIHPKEGEWPTYNGNISGNRFSPLDEINTSNISQLAPRWMFTLPGTRRALEDTPQVIDGVMYVTGSNECFALDARTGKQLWHYSRPRTKDLVPTGDAISGINRGVAILGDRVFMITDNARLIALQRYTGKLVWDVEMADYKLNYGATQAPLIVGDLVISGISGGDEGVRGFLSAYRASTGERVWRFWTVPAPGEPGSETWVGTSINHPGSSTWMTGTYDPVTDILYWGVGNPGPDFNGDQRKGDNLYSCSILALNPHTGKLIWYHQMTPHNLHDWDSTQTPMLVDADFQGKPRKLLLQGNRNGYFYVLDRLTGEFLLGAPFIHNMSWSSGLEPKTGRPILKGDPTPTYEGTRVCPGGAGATNWPSASFDPQTGQFLVFATESCVIFTKNDESFEYGKSFYQGTEKHSPNDTTKKFLRAIDIQTGNIAWEIPNIGGGPLDSGLMTTAGGFVFYGDASGAVVAADAKDGKILWHFNTGQQFKGSPMAYTIDGKERLVFIAGQTVLSFGIR